ncbi:hypothetical protein PLICRDRAFT_45814 [Plicaturopsis crispa FD-325 SS-3]|uniref:Uncharacterized protein n=1 Tax=Plicaturopsis crispa FD-325 SS-3 TaxID=944288 RepID=A0A0C9T6J5_PLICR|nr:hypothetical protein PLICRDRAFT_45814 [Plicaturopsis crispa FD-325 SS-3]
MPAQWSSNSGLRSAALATVPLPWAFASSPCIPARSRSRPSLLRAYPIMGVFFCLRELIAGVHNTWRLWERCDFASVCVLGPCTSGVLWRHFGRRRLRVLAFGIQTTCVCLPSSMRCVLVVDPAGPAPLRIAMVACGMHRPFVSHGSLSDDGHSSWATDAFPVDAGMRATPLVQNLIRQTYTVSQTWFLATGPRCASISLCRIFRATCMVQYEPIDLRASVSIDVCIARRPAVCRCFGALRATSSAFRCGHLIAVVCPRWCVRV